jgi:hypothetical protein
MPPPPPSPTGKYAVKFFVNDVLTSSLENLSAAEAYSHAIPGEALQPHAGNRWHVMMRAAALDRMDLLGVGEFVTVAYQEASLNPEMDIEMIVIEKTDGG